MCAERRGQNGTEQNGSAERAIKNYRASYKESHRWCEWSPVNRLRSWLNGKEGLLTLVRSRLQSVCFLFSYQLGWWRIVGRIKKSYFMAVPYPVNIRKQSFPHYAFLNNRDLHEIVQKIEWGLYYRPGNNGLGTNKEEAWMDENNCSLYTWLSNKARDLTSYCPGGGL